MSLAKCDLTGSEDRVEAVHADAQTDKVKKVCFAVGIKVEKIRQKCIQDMKGYDKGDYNEKLKAKVQEAVKELYEPKKAVEKPVKPEVTKTVKKKGK